MIEYESGGINYILKIFQYRGSVFPQSLCVALPCACLAALLRYFMNTGHLDVLAADGSILTETQAWSGFSFLVGFLIVFRTSQAYNRFWEGCSATHQMRAEWFDAASALIAFCRCAKASEQEVLRFKHTLIRLFSMLHATALAELEEVNQQGKSTDEIKAYSFELFDASGIDEESLFAIKESHCKVELIFSWIQLLIVEHIETGVLCIASPILSRSFQEIANGMVAFHDSLKITYIPFPFPYAQTCDCLLLLHWMVVPFVTSQWVHYPVWAGVFVFIQVFILWSLNFIAVEIENPFGTDSNDLNGEYMQREMNRNLVMLLEPATTRLPILEAGREAWTPTSADYSSDILKGPSGCGLQALGFDGACFLEVWEQLETNEGIGHQPATSSARKGDRFRNCDVEKAYLKKKVRLSVVVQSSGSWTEEETLGGRRNSRNSRSSNGPPSTRRSSVRLDPTSMHASISDAGGSELESEATQSGIAIGRDSSPRKKQVVIGTSSEQLDVYEQLDVSGQWEAVGSQGEMHGTSSHASGHSNDSSRLDKAYLPDVPSQQPHPASERPSRPSYFTLGSGFGSAVGARTLEEFHHESTLRPHIEIEESGLSEDEGGNHDTGTGAVYV